MNGVSRVSDISQRYLDIFGEFYAPICRGRFKELHASIVYFATKDISRNFDLNGSFDFIIDEVRLYHAVESYFFDIIRYKEFHFSHDGSDILSIHREVDSGENYVNFAKQSGYMVKWILKNKPLILMRRQPEYLCINGDCPQKTVRRAALSELQQEIIVNINEIFALKYASGILNLSQSSDPVWFKRMVYNLHYRPLDEGNLSEIFEELSKAA